MSAYTKTNWSNDAPPPINAANLNKIEQGVADAHTELATHEGRTDNPHAVTAAQAGAYSQSESDSRFVNATGDSMTGALDIQRALVADLLLHGRVTGDTVQRIEATAAGKIGWGPGNAAVDTFLERVAAAVLELTGSLQPEADGTRDIGSATKHFRDIYFSGLVKGTGLVPPANRQFKGALVLKNAAQSIPGSATTPLTWQVEQYDTDSFFDPGQPTRLTVPSGVTRVRLSAGLTFATSFPELTVMQILKNGVIFNGAPITRNNGNGGGGLNISTPVLVITPGDFFESTIFQGNATAKDVSATGNTWFALEVIQ